MDSQFPRFTAFFVLGLSVTVLDLTLSPAARAQSTIQFSTNLFRVAVEFTNYWAGEATESVVVGIVRSDGGESPISVDYATTDGSAKAGVDYASTAGTVTFAPSEKLKSIIIPILNDGAKEAAKTFSFGLSHPSAAGTLGPSTATVTILDNDPGVSFATGQLWVSRQANQVELTVLRGNDFNLGPFSVDFATRNGTALAGEDFADTSGTLRFAAFEMSKALVIPILSQVLVPQRDKQFQVILSNIVGMELGSISSSTVTLVDTLEMKAHRIESIEKAVLGNPALVLGGGFVPGRALSNRFEPYLDIYPLEVSTDLRNWTPLTLVLRTNSASHTVTYVDTAALEPQRFYRVAATNLIAPQLPPTGPYRVGWADRLVTDPSRRNRYRISTNSSFAITIWYPAEPQAGQLPASYEYPLAAKDPRWWTGWVDRVTWFHSFSFTDAPFAHDVHDCPVILYSSEAADYRLDGQENCINLASWGYVVIAVDAVDDVTVLPNGTFYFFGPNDLIGRETSEASLASRVTDLTFVLNELERWNQADDFYRGRLDTSRVGSLGWATGGVAASEFARIDPRCQTVVQLDSDSAIFSLVPDFLRFGLKKPSLTLKHVGNSGSSLFDKTSGVEAVSLAISGTEHASFSSYYWVPSDSSNLLPGPMATAREAARTINAYTLAFFDKHLRGNAANFPLDGFPRVVNFKKK